MNEKRQWTPEDMQKLDEMRAAELHMDEKVTAAEIFCAEVLSEELRAAGRKPGDEAYTMMTNRAAELLVVHRYEVRDMYRKSKGTLKQWLMNITGMKNMRAYRKMNEMGLTGDIMEDMKKLGVD